MDIVSENTPFLASVLNWKDFCWWQESTGSLNADFLRLPGGPVHANYRSEVCDDEVYYFLVYNGPGGCDD